MCRHSGASPAKLIVTAGPHCHSSCLSVTAITNHHTPTLPTPQVRDPRAGYLQSLAVLRAAKSVGVYTKSSIMLGLGETEDEIIDTMMDLKDCGVDIFTLGQYLQVGW